MGGVVLVDSDTGSGFSTGELVRFDSGFAGGRGDLVCDFQGRRAPLRDSWI